MADLNKTVVFPAEDGDPIIDAQGIGSGVGKKSDGALTRNEAVTAYGVPGNTGRYGYAWSDEYIAELEGLEGRKTFDMMRRSDTQIMAVLRAVKMPILKTKFFVEPGSADPRDQMIAATIEKNLFEEMAWTWYDFLRHALLFLDFGFMVFEEVYEYRGNIMRIKALEPRLPSSIWRWEPQQEDAGKFFRITGITQLDNYGRQYFIPIEKIMLLTNDREGDNWEGTSLLRACYRNWTSKNQLIRIDVMKHDRNGVGFAVMTVPKGVKPGSIEHNAAVKIVKNIHANSQAGAVLNEGTALSFEGMKGSGGTDAIPSIQYHDEQIAKAILAMFINLGTTATGSRALGQSFVDTFVQAIQSFADMIAQTLTNGPIKKMVDFNWIVNGVYPKLRASAVDDIDTHQVAELIRYGALTPDDDIQEALRKSLNLPVKPKAAPVTPQTDAGKIGTKLSLGKVAKGKQLRKPNQYEALCDLRTYDLELDTKEQSVLQQILQIRSVQIREIVAQVMSGAKASRIKAPKKAEMFALLMKAYQDMVAQGRNQVGIELKKQKDTGLTIHDVPQTIQAAQPKKKPTPQSQMNLADDELSLLIEGSTDKLTSQINQIALEGRRQGLETYQLEAYIMKNIDDEITDSNWAGMVAKAVSQGWGDGRQQEADAQGVGFAYYSSILDENTCAECSATQDAQNNLPDGVHQIDDPDFEAPNPECEGNTSRGQFCRCINIYVSEG